MITMGIYSRLPSGRDNSYPKPLSFIPFCSFYNLSFDWDFTTKLTESGGGIAVVVLEFRNPENLSPKNFLHTRLSPSQQFKNWCHCRHRHRLLRCPSDAPDYYSQRQVELIIGGEDGGWQQPGICRRQYQKTFKSPDRIVRSPSLITLCSKFSWLWK